MVEIVYRPFKRVVILERNPLSLDELCSNIGVVVKGGQSVALNWAEGVLFFYVAMSPETDKLLDEYLDGTVYWSSVTFALMEKFKPIIKIDGYEVSVVNVSPNPTLREIATWLKKS